MNHFRQQDINSHALVAIFIILLTGVYVAAIGISRKLSSEGELH